ncbi:hypothetical protein [Tardiphaga sp.]|uniref:hypothetical protein n=1 Tax=Tardiphaga sp. TaxID=1926292 RepID=UPI00352BA382
MEDSQTCRAKESLCRQRASFFPEESWKHLAEAEMWQHKAMKLIAERHADCNQPVDKAAA